MSGTSTVVIILLAFIFISLMGFHAQSRKKKPTEDEVEEEVQFSLGDMSLVATREPLLSSKAAPSAVTKQKNNTQAPVSSLRGATRVKPKADQVDYSIYDAPTFLRRGIQLSF
jgi:hypothetical protein